MLLVVILNKYQFINDRCETKKKNNHNEIHEIDKNLMQYEIASTDFYLTEHKPAKIFIVR